MCFSLVIFTLLKLIPASYLLGTLVVRICPLVVGFVMLLLYQVLLLPIYGTTSSQCYCCHLNQFPIQCPNCGPYLSNSKFCIVRIISSNVDLIICIVFVAILEGIYETAYTIHKDILAFIFT